MAMQMRYLQTLVEISAENTSTVVFPFPMDMFKMFMQMTGQVANVEPVPPSKPPEDRSNSGTAKVETIRPDL